MKDTLTHIPWRSLLFFLHNASTAWQARNLLSSASSRIMIAAALAGTTSVVLKDQSGLFSLPTDHSAWIAYAVGLLLLSLVACALLESVHHDRGQ